MHWLPPQVRFVPSGTYPEAGVPPRLFAFFTVPSLTGLSQAVTRILLRSIQKYPPSVAACARVTKPLQMRIKNAILKTRALMTSSRISRKSEDFCIGEKVMLH
jgi:hypothetical protein